MSGEWETLYQIGIWFWGGLFTLTILLMWARTVRKYWLGEMNRDEIQEKGDANEDS